MDDYDSTLFEDVEVEPKKEQGTAANPLRTFTAGVKNVWLMHHRRLMWNGHVTDTSIPDHISEPDMDDDDPELFDMPETFDGSHEGRVPVTDDGRPGHYKMNTHEAPPSSKPSTEDFDIPQLSELTIYLMMSIFIVAGIVIPHITMLECLSYIGEDRYLLAADKEGPSKSRVRRSAAALRQFLAGMIRLPRGITVDSGAADSVFPASWLRKALLRASPGSVARQFYVAASGTRLDNLGQFLLKFTTREGFEGGIIFQVASVNKPLASVSHLTDIGYCVVFNKHEGKDVSYLMHKETKQFWKLRRERGVFVIDAFLSENIAPRSDAEKIVDAGFARPGTP